MSKSGRANVPGPRFVFPYPTGREGGEGGGGEVVDRLGRARKTYDCLNSARKTIDRLGRPGKG